MSSGIWNEIELRVDEHGFMTGLERSRERIGETAEVFTPSRLVVAMIQRIPREQYGPGKTVIDPACGDGQFLVAIKWAKILIHRMAENQALNDLFGVDIMRDNVDICFARLGGGTIVMGDSLNPSAELPGQTDVDRQMMARLFGIAPAPERLFSQA